MMMMLMMTIIKVAFCRWAGSELPYQPLFQSEVKCKASDRKKTHFHNQGFALSLVFKMRVLNSEMAYFSRCPLSNATLTSFSLSPGLFVRRPCPLVWPAQKYTVVRSWQLFYVLDWFLDTGSSTRKKPDFRLHVCVVVSYAQRPFKLIPARPTTCWQSRGRLPPDQVH